MLQPEESTTREHVSSEQVQMMFLLLEMRERTMHSSDFLTVGSLCAGRNTCTDFCPTFLSGNIVGQTPREEGIM